MHDEKEITDQKWGGKDMAPLKTPTKAEFMEAMIPVATEILMDGMDGKFTLDEFLGIAKSLINAGGNLYGIEYEIVKKIPKLVKPPDIHR